ncbi:chloride channel protein [Streptococcus gallolyticus]|nr:chloride channel protein [Streptococcus gallolyticus]MBY5041545.1 chloride channel protein [Streptococcus gallolyticus]
MENHRKEYRFVHQAILGYVLRGVLVGVVAGGVVAAFRLAIEKLFEFVVHVYKSAHSHPIYLLGIALVYLVLVFFLGWLIKGDGDIKGSGIPHVEAELKGLMNQNWWSVLWRKFIAGTIAIGSGLMLGREGPSIQLGAVAGKGVATWLKASQMEKRSLIASGAAAGLAAAFNAPIAGLLFVVEEVYHQFSRLVWISALAASITANFISLNIFGLTPVLNMPDHLPMLELQYYWGYVLLGIFLGLAGFIYEKVILNMNMVYGWLGKVFHLQPAYHSLIAFVLILPIGYYLPELLGGGNGLVLSLAHHMPLFSTLVVYLLVRFVWSMMSYGSGLPGGIFLPILALGSILGMLGGRFAFDMGMINQSEVTIFIILGMAGFFAAISKAPLTAIILVTEMVGDMRQLMVIGLVSLTAYIIMDLLGGAPVYEAMLENLLPEKMQDNSEMTLIEVIVSEKIADKFVSDLKLPHNTLITSQVSHGKSQVVKGNSKLHLGDSIFLAVPVSDIQKVREMLEF